MEAQPTDTELHTAWTNAINAEGLGGAHSQALQDLRQLRDKRTTWFGEKENNLRHSLNTYLRHYGA